MLSVASESLHLAEDSEKSTKNIEIAEGQNKKSETLTRKGRVHIFFFLLCSGALGVPVPGRGAPALDGLSVEGSDLVFPDLLAEDEGNVAGRRHGSNTHGVQRRGGGKAKRPQERSEVLFSRLK